VRLPTVAPGAIRSAAIMLPSAGVGLRKSVSGSAGFNDLAGEGEPVDDRRRIASDR
jgi:hypothetical protein